MDTNDWLKNLKNESGKALIAVEQIKPHEDSIVIALRDGCELTIVYPYGRNAFEPIFAKYDWSIDYSQYEELKTYESIKP